MRASTAKYQEPSEFLTAAEVLHRYSAGRMWIERRIKDSGFPKPIKLGNGTMAVRRWRRADLIQWEATRMEKAS